MRDLHPVRHIVFGAILAVAFAGLLGAQNQHRFVAVHRHSPLAMLPLQEQDSPLTIRSTTHTIVDALTTGELQNSTTRAIVAYKMGWMYVFRDASRKPEPTIGVFMNVPAGIAPGNTTIVPAQGILVAEIPEDAKAVVFFVAEVEFADDKSFSADIEKLALRAVKDGAELK